MIATTYTVQSGDCLYSIAEREYGEGNDWPLIWEANKNIVSDPYLIYPGERLRLPSAGPKHAALAAEVKHNDNYKRSYNPKHSNGAISGNLSCSGLEQLWVYNGGRIAAKFIAAEIAMAESGGRQFALSPTSDYGYWQINVSHGPDMASFDPNTNARAAIEISDDGTNWEPWTTYRTGAYEGQC